MLELNSRKLEVKFNGEIFNLKFPTVKEMRLYSDGYDKADDKTKVIVDFIASLGMPSDKCEQLEVEHLEMLLKELTSTKK
jgi:catalase (peroxidase I)